MARTHDLRVSRDGFTLVELVAVVVLLGILSGTVMWSLSGHVHRSRLVQAADRIEALDRRARSRARRTAQPVRIVWDENEHTAHIEPVSSGQENRTPHQVRLGQQVEMDVFAPRQQPDRSRDILISPLGQSASYALKLIAPNDAQLWIVTLGLSGQQLRYETREEAYAVLGR